MLFLQTFQKLPHRNGYNKEDETLTNIHLISIS